MWCLLGAHLSAHMEYSWAWHLTNALLPEAFLLRVKWTKLGFVLYGAPLCLLPLCMLLKFCAAPWTMVLHRSFPLTMLGCGDVLSKGFFFARSHVLFVVLFLLLLCLPFVDFLLFASSEELWLAIVVFLCQPLG